MKMVMCSIRDQKAEAWLNPMFFLARAQAVRSFQDAVNGREGDIAKHPEDYTLFHLGYFDQLTGEVEVIAPTSLGVGINFKNES